jgi:hypothetical protein
MVVRSREETAVLVIGYGVAAFIGYVTFSQFPESSKMAVFQMVLFYVATLIYPPWWTLQHLRTLRRLGLDDKPELRRHAWAPVIVGGTAFATALGLLRALL